MRWIDRLHRWTGGCIGLLLALLGLTGTLLVYKDVWLRATVPHADEPLVADILAQTAALERLLQDSSARPTSVLFPSESLGLYRLSLEGGGGAYADQSGSIVASWASKWDRLELWLFDFHHHLWMGGAGTKLAGVLGLIGLGFVVTGLILWWRMRRSFAFRLLPARYSRLQIVRHHRDLGVVAAPLLIVSMLTGAMLTLRPVADVLLAPLSPPGTIARSLAAPTARGGALAPSFDWGQMLRTAQEQFPDAQVRSLGLPSKPGDLVRVRLKQPFEWLPNGRTMLWFDGADGRLVDARDAASLPLATRAFNTLYPLHAAKVGGVVYTAAMTAAGIALTLLGSLTVWSFWGFQVRNRAPGASVPSPRPRPLADPGH